ncbi:hypothetical protein Ade02nite_70900 [Paractinoplanes deccanensis]|uniref:Uncharacterized protein n=1 Tax=Paractinoplanes deccanensis TaxID=113561 RepID=A0ABQ3YEM9_9ACTN|nr:hypothetical protein [Actinoplanes deccanensis]GID78449.1 hypothetical protein Ade02nite_70900 [Actinoplanes deccanensis]
MDILRQALCAMGRHSGEWSHPGSRCETIRTCSACGRTEERSRHDWGDWGYAGGCEQVRRCLRCGAPDSWPDHDWGPWLYANTEFNSPQVRTCRRCHTSERTSPTYR